MPPTRSSTAASLTQYLQSINGDLHLASVLAFRASSPPTPSLSQSHVIELVLWVEEDQEDVRSRFSVASVELERLDVVAQSMGGKAGDVEGFRRMLLAKGEEKAAQQGEKSEEGTKTYSVVVFAIYRRPPAPGAGTLCASLLSAFSTDPPHLLVQLSHNLKNPSASSAFSTTRFQHPTPPLQNFRTPAPNSKTGGTFSLGAYWNPGRVTPSLRSWHRWLC